jgi:hypothetical protein
MEKFSQKELIITDICSIQLEDHFIYVIPFLET